MLTEESKFVEKQYKSRCSKNVHIVVKKEHTQEYQQPIGSIMIPAITYGYGDMKINGCKKFRISYIVLLDCNCKAIWSYVTKSK